MPFNNYNLSLAANAARSVLTAGGAAILAGLCYLIIPYITPVLPSRRIDALLIPLLAAVGVGLWRLFYAVVFVQPVFQRRAIVVGVPDQSHDLLDSIT